MSARTLIGFVLALTMLTATAFGEEQKRDQRNNPKSPQYKEFTELQRISSTARLSLPEACEEVLCLLIIQKQADPARFTDEAKAALRDCEKFYMRTERHWVHAYGLLCNPNLMNEEDKLAECRDTVARLAWCAMKFNTEWRFLLTALTGDEWKAATDEMEKEDAAEKDREDKDKNEKK
ncbi:MAG: hypothetical protein Q7R85_00320 [bacterium]|nr:hypothetical protein [bacterium]